LALQSNAVTIRIDWDRRCNVSWVLRLDDGWWKATNPPESWGTMLDGSTRTGTVVTSSDTSLTYLDDDGSRVNFVIDDPSETPCS
jgi:hypothetical protein